METNEQLSKETNDIPSDPQIKEAIKDLKISVPTTAEVNVQSDSETGNAEDSVREMNTFFEQKYHIYNDILAPQLKKNEKLKREHKRVLLQKLFKFLKLQFIATYIIVAMLIIMVGANMWLNITETIIAQIFDFLKFYITTIVAELIAILFFIVKNVFDKSIFDLFKNFDKEDNKDINNK